MAKKHTLIVIGWMGVQQAYLDIPLEEAIRRYKKYNYSIDGEPIEVLEFDDTLSCYNVSVSLDEADAVNYPRLKRVGL